MDGTSNMDDLDSILNGEEQEAPQEQQPEEQPQEVEQTEGDGQPRGPDGKFAPKGKKEDVMPASEEATKQIPIQSYQAEKQKRQELEQQIEALRREMAAAAQQQQTPEPPPSIWDDDQAALGYVHNSAVQTAVQQATYQAKLQMSEMMAGQEFEDFATVKDELFEFVGKNPSINQQVMESQHPWRTAYNAYQAHKTMTELGATNIDELKAQLLEQLKAEQAQAAPQQPNLPQSLADAQSSRGQNTPAPKPLTLEEILGS